MNQQNQRVFFPRIEIRRPDDKALERDLVLGRIPESLGLPHLYMADGIADPHFTAQEIDNVIEFATATGTKFDKKLDARKGENDFWTNAVIEAARK